MPSLLTDLIEKSERKPELIQEDIADQTQFDFEMQEQIAENWCWAATVASIEDYFRRTDVNGKLRKGLHEEKERMSQCVVAARDLKLSQPCCEIKVVDGIEQRYVVSDWNIQNALSAPLNQLGCHDRTVLGPPGSKHIEERVIRDKLPVCCRVVWEDELRGAHFTVITGVMPSVSRSPSNLILILQDSLYGQTFAPLKTFIKAYQPNEITSGGAKRGRVTHTYLLKRPSNDGA